MRTQFRGRLSFITVQLSLLLTLLSGKDGIAASASCLDVVTYNIRFNTPQDGAFAWPYRKDAVGDLLLRSGADLLALQEVFVGELQDLAQRLPGFDWIAAGADDGERLGEMLPVFYQRERFELLQQGTFWLSMTPGKPAPAGGPYPWGTALNHIVTWAQLKERDSQTVFFLLNTHLDHQSAEARRKSAEQIQLFAQNLASGPIILAGDLNMPAESIDMGMLLGKGSFSDAIEDSMTSPLINPKETTLTKWGDLVGIGSRIDHVLTRRVAAIESYRTIETKYEVSGQQIYPSDHLPVLARLCMGVGQSGNQRLPFQ